jgi:hypothetical protein
VAGDLDHAGTELDGVSCVKNSRIGSDWRFEEGEDRFSFFAYSDIIACVRSASSSGMRKWKLGCWA